MRNFIIAGLIATTILSACSNSGNKTQSSEAMDCCKGVYSPKTILDSAEQLLDKQIRLKANVTRVCHCGSNITMTDMQDSTASIYVLAGGDIPKFNQCLKGKHANITGYLRVKKITQTDLDSSIIKLENKLAELAGKTDSTSLKTSETLKQKIENTKTANQEKSDWMKAHNSDFYPNYYFESEKFADCCKKKNDPEAVASADEGCGKHGDGHGCGKH